MMSRASRLKGQSSSDITWHPAVPVTVDARMIEATAGVATRRHLLCSPPFLLAPALITWGVCALGTALGTLSITTSFFVVFPFGAPIWTSTLFLVLGCFMLAVFRPGDQPPLMTSKAQALFTLVASILAVLETLLATGLSLWYAQVTYPALERCTSTAPQQTFHTCECSSGFINPPSLRRIVYTFDRVEDCDLIGRDLVIFKHVLLGLYCLGTVVTLVLTFAASKKLKSVGFCGKSGTYLVTPAPSAPSGDSSVSRQPSFSSSHPSAGYASVSIIQRVTAASSYQASLEPSPAMSTARPHSSHAMI